MRFSVSQASRNQPTHCHQDIIIVDTHVFRETCKESGSEKDSTQRTQQKPRYSQIERSHRSGYISLIRVIRVPLFCSDGKPEIKMGLKTETSKFLRELEQYSDRTLNYPEEVGSLIEAARDHGKTGVLDEAIFLAKFITKSAGVMKRIGADGEGYGKLASEFHSNIQKVTALLKTVFELAPEDLRRQRISFFFSLTQESLEHLMLLLVDLTIVKNWVLDGKTLPLWPVSG